MLVINGVSAGHELEQITCDNARKYDLLPRDLLIQTLLHLPRLRPAETKAYRRTVAAEVTRLAALMRQRRANFRTWTEPHTGSAPSIAEANFEQIEESRARVIHERFHYLASFRFESLHLGLTWERNQYRRLMALLTVSPFDLPHVTAFLPPEVTAQEVKVVSRVYSFDWAPLNTVSSLMGETFRFMRDREPNTRVLLTYLNPNLGFRGTSYEASNWVSFGHEHGTRYAYLDGSYITDRELRRKFGTADPAALGSGLGPRFSVTTVPMKPLRLYAYFIDRRLRSHYRDGFDHQFRSP